MRELKENPAPPAQLFRKDENEFKPIITRLGGELWACGECGSLQATFATQNETPQERAAKCCLQTKCECGNNKESHYDQCNMCQQLARDQKREADAEFVDSHDGWIYVEGYGQQEGYFDSEESLKEWIDNENYNSTEQLMVPEFAFVCREKTFSHIDMHDVVSNELEEFYEDAIEKCDIDPLQKFVDQWVKEQNVVSYEVDFSRKVKLWT